MYKDVWKRVLAVAVTICLVVTFVQWPTRVKAEETKTYHLYQHGGDGDAGIVKARRAAAVFTVSQNEDGEAEILESATFDLHVEEGTDASQTKATVAYYVRPAAGTPDLGKFVCSDELYGLVEGTNRIDLNSSLMEMEPGTTFAIIVTLTGEGVSFYADELSEEGRTYIDQEDGTWKDLAAEQSVLNIRAITYDVETEEVSIVTRIRSAFSRSSAEPEVPVDAPADVPSADAGADDAVLPPGQDITDGGNNEGGEQAPPADGEQPPVDSESGDNQTPPDTGDSSGGDTQTPPDTSEPPAGDTQVPTEPATDTTETQAPSDTSDPSVGDTQTPSDTNDPSAGDTQAPAETESTQTPSDTNDPSVGDTQAPAETESTQTPSDTNDPSVGDTQVPTEPATETTETTEIQDPADEPEDTEDGPATIGGEGIEKPEKLPERDTTSNVKMDPAMMIIGVSETATLTLTTGGGTGVVWTSRNPEIATVTGSGSWQADVRGAMTGQTVITADYQGKTYTCDVYVIASAESLTVSFSEGNKVLYDGQPHNPVMTVMLGELTLAEGHDYQSELVYIDPNGVEYTSGIEGASNGFRNAGTYRYDITGIKGVAGFSGSFQAPFVIETKNINHEDVICEIDEKLLTASGKPESYLKIRDEGRGEALVIHQDYEISVQNGRIILTGIGNYTGERRLNEPKSLATAQISFTATNDEHGLVRENGECVYTGEERQPGINVTLGDVVLARDRDYTISYVGERTNVNGTPAPSVVITGINDYYGTAQKPFSIIAKDIGEADVNKMVSASRDDAGNLVPEATIVYRNRLLTKDKDFTIRSVSEDLAAGTGTYEVTGIGNFSGTATGIYKIDVSDISTIVKGIQPIVKEYTGGKQEPYSEIELIYHAGAGVTNLIPDTDYTVRFENNTSAGTPRVIIEGKGRYTGQKVIQDKNAFEIKPVDFATSTDIKVSPASGGSIFYSPVDGEMVQKVEVTFRTNADPSGSITLAEGTDYTITRGANAGLGKKTITITGQGNFVNDKILEYTIVPCELREASLAGKIKVEITHPELPYGSRPEDAGIRVYYVADNGGLHELTEGSKGESGKDFYIEYQPKDATRGPVRAEIHGMNNYTGALLADFEISGTAIEDCSVSVDPSTQGLVNGYQNGAGLYMAMLWLGDGDGKLKIIVKDPSGAVLTEGDDYKLSYENYSQMSKRGTYAKVKITGQGKYFGEKTYGYLIAKELDGCTINLPDEKPEYTGQKVTLSGVDVRVGGILNGWLGDKLQEGEDYNLVYQDNIDVNGVNGSNPIVEVDAVEFKYLPTKNGCFVYRNTVKAQKPFTIKPADLKLAELKRSIVKDYDGVPVKLTGNDVYLSFGGRMLVEGTDYEFQDTTYSQNNGVNKENEYASVKIAGKNNFDRWKEIEFKIIAKESEELSSYIVEKAFYNGGKEVRPDVTVHVRVGNTVQKLTPGTDYDLEYHNNVNVGDEATVTITGKGAYSYLSHEEPFEIQPQKLYEKGNGTGTSVTGVDKTGSVYTSQPIIQTGIKVQFGFENNNTQTLREGKDYTLEYRDNVNAGTAYLRVKGLGNYTGVYEEPFEIQKKSLQDTDIKLDPLSTQGENIDGTAVRPPVTIKYQYGTGKEDVYLLQSPTDYTVEYENNFSITNSDDEKDWAKVIITASDVNFKDGLEARFKIGINIGDPNKVQIVYDDSNKPYTGVQYTPPVTLYRVKNGSTDKPLKEGKDYKVTYGENINAGIGIIKIEGMGLYGGIVEKYFTIDKINIEEVNAKLYIDHFGTLIGDGSYSAEYTGHGITPELKLFVGTTPVDNLLEEFSINWGNNIDRGEVLFELVALNKNYTGKLDVNNTDGAAKFTIRPRNIGYGEELAAGFSMDVIQPQPLENGKAEPVPKIYFKGVDGDTGISRLLVKDTDFICAKYERNTYVNAKASVTVQGINNYEGEVIIYFEIKDSINNAIVEMPGTLDFLDERGNERNENAIHKLIEDDLHVYLKNADGSKGKEVPKADYEVSYGVYNGVGPLLVTVTPKKTSSLTGEYKGYVHIWGELTSADKDIEIKIDDQEYTGGQLRPVPVVTFHGKTLMAGSHFTVTYGPNIGPGQAGTVGGGTVTIEGNEEFCFKGVMSANFNIVMMQKPFTIEGVKDSYKFRGEPICPTAPDVIVRTSNKVLVQNVDYILTYGENMYANTDNAYVRAEGIGAYGNSYSNDVKFTIQPLDVGELIVKEGDHEGITDKEYTGSTIYPENLSVWYREGSKEYRMDRNGWCTIQPLATADNVSAGVGTLILDGDGQNIVGRREITFKIIGRTLKPEGVEIVGNGFTYNGQEHRPAVIVRDGDVILDNEIDYTVSYKDNVNAGTATVIVTGNGNYSGKVEKTFQIARYNFSNDAQILLPNGYDYPFMGTGGVKPPMVVQLTSNQNILAETTDYTVSYSNNTAYSGTARITITGQGNYTGTATQTFNITRHDIAAEDVIVEPIPNQGFTGYEIVPEITITCGEYGLQKNRDYELEFPDGNVNIGNVRVIIRGKNGFTNFREEVFYIGYDLKNAEVIGLKKSYPYTGEKYELGTPGLGITGVRMGDLVLATTSYKLEYAAGSNGISAGEQVLVLTGQGEYGGSVEKTFEITPKNIRDEDVVMEGFVDDMPYEANITQKITLRWGNITLKEGEDRDYTMVCERSNKPGIWTMTLQGVGNYTGTITKNFSVDQKDISDAEVKNISSIYTYTGEPIIPEIEVLLGGRRLVEGRDYRVVGIQDNVNAGTAKIWLEGIGNYTGECEVTFQIDRKSVQNVSVSSIGTQVYTGLDIEPAVSVSDGGRGLAMGVDYSVVYADNRKPGTGSAIVTGQGNYTATKSIPFNIRPGSVTNIAVTATTSTSISLRWSGTGVVTGFEIYRAGDDGSYVRIGRRRVLEDYTDTQLTAGKNYYYKVRAYLVTDGEVYYSEFSPVAQGRI